MALVQIPGGPAAATTTENEQLPLAVPVTAVLDSGIRKLVYVERAKGQYAAVEIETGPRADNSYPVIRGLQDGDVVVTRGSFLLDSQFQVRGLPSLFYREGQSAALGHQHGRAPAAPAPSASVKEASGHGQHKP